MMMYLSLKDWLEIFSQEWILWESLTKRKIKSKRFVTLWDSSLYLKIFKLIKLCNYLKLWVQDIQLWLLVLQVQEKVQLFKYFKKSKEQSYIPLIQNQLLCPSFMVKCIRKQDNGLMAYFQKLSGLLMKNLQEEKRSPDGFCMMEMLMRFGSRTWTLWWMITNC